MFSPQKVSRFLQFLGFPSIDFVQILMKQYLFSISFALVKTASFDHYPFRNGIKNHVTCKKTFFQQLVIFNGHVHEDADKGSWGR